MHTSTKKRLIQLNSKLGKTVTEFVAIREDKDGLAKKAAVGAGVLGAGYAGASLLRGRQWQKKVVGAVDNSVPGLLGALKAGHQMNVIGARGAVRGAKAGTSAFVQGSKEKLLVGAAGAAAKAAPVIDAAKAAATKLKLKFK